MPGLKIIIQSSTRIVLVDARKLMAKRTITAAVASRRHRTAVTMNTVFNEYGFTKSGMTPNGGVRAGTLWGSVVPILPLMLAVDEAGEDVEVGTAVAEKVYPSRQCHPLYYPS